MAAAESLDKFRAIRATLQRKRDHLQAGDPAFGARLEPGDILDRQVQPHHLIQESAGFFQCKAQIVDPRFEQQAAPAETRQREGWVGARGDHQMHKRRLALDQEAQEVMHRLVSDELVIVQHNGKRLTDFTEIVIKAVSRYGNGTAWPERSISPAAGQTGELAPARAASNARTK